MHTFRNSSEQVSSLRRETALVTRKSVQHHSLSRSGGRRNHTRAPRFLGLQAVQGRDLFPFCLNSDNPSVSWKLDWIATSNVDQGTNICPSETKQLRYFNISIFFSLSIEYSLSGYKTFKWIEMHWLNLCEVRCTKSPTHLARQNSREVWGSWEFTGMGS